MIGCERCGQLGILHMVVNGTSEETLGYCVCAWAKMRMQIWRLPRIDSKLSGVFKISACPLEWFRPENPVRSAPIVYITPSIQTVIDIWRARVRAAEAFWQEHADTFEVVI